MPRLCNLSADRRHSWHRMPLAALPNLPACYAIFAAERLAYIGSAVDVRDRVREHGLLPTKHRHPTPIVPIAIATIRVAFNRRRFEHATRELRLIFRLAPPLNAKRVGTSARQRNRQRRISDAIDRGRDRSPVHSVQQTRDAAAAIPPSSINNATR